MPILPKEQILQLSESLKGLNHENKTARVIAAGYVRPTGKCAWTTYYEELLDAKGITSETIFADDVKETYQLMRSFVDSYSSEYGTEISEYWKDWSDAVSDYDQETVDDYIKDYGLENIEYIFDYQNLVDDYDERIVNQYIRLYDLDELGYFSDRFVGIYSSAKQFAQEYVETDSLSLPFYVSIDWGETWHNLSTTHVFDENTGAVFQD